MDKMEMDQSKNSNLFLYFELFLMIIKNVFMYSTFSQWNYTFTLKSH